MKLAGFLILSCLIMQSAFADDTKTLTRLPRVGDETSVAKIIANPGQ